VEKDYIVSTLRIKKWAEGMAHMAECLTRKCKALCYNPGTTKKTKQKTNVKFQRYFG
jgi:hypothetical protein